MKTKILLILILSGLISEVNQMLAQSPVTIYTPKNSPLYEHTRPELLEPEDKEDISEEMEYYYQQATEIDPPSSTTTFNCHAYAWHISEGGSTCTIAYYYGDTDESAYWNDYSYIETTETYASKVSYLSDDHSAIQTSTQGIYRSKWGDYPIMQHAYNYGPYDYSSRKYYRLNPYVTGSSTELCETVERTFSSNMAISGSTYSWTKDNNYLDYVSGAGTTDYRVEAKNDVDGYAWLRLQITTPSGEVAYSPYHYVWVGKPLPSIDGPDEIECYSPEWYFVDVDSRQWSDFDWSTDYNMDITSGTTGFKAEAQGLDEGYGQIFVEVTNDCGSNENRLVVYVNCSKFLISPNPASSIVKVTVITPESEVNLVENNIPVTYKVNIYDLNGVLYNSATKSGNEFTFNVSALRNGNYVVIINDGSKTTSMALIVKH
jgi:hypothetical protein